MRIPVAVVLGLLLAAPAMACDFPQQTRVIVPNGNTATMDEMLEAQQEVRTYVEAMEAFIALTQDEDTLEELSDTERENFRVMVERRDAAVQQVQEVAEEFNTQVRVFQEQGDN